LQLPFYLTGGTALGRFYLRHRYSEDLDFFLNADDHFMNHLSFIRKEISKSFHINLDESLFTNDFARFYLQEGSVPLKIEFVNEVEFRAGQPAVMPFGLIDTPLNILSNKLTALISRDEPKDVYDLIHIAATYSFHWVDIFNDAKRKAIINEIDIERRLVEFPVITLQTITPLENAPDIKQYTTLIQRIADDFLLGSSNSLGTDKPSIEDAKPFTLL